MTYVNSDSYRTLGRVEAIADGHVMPYYLEDLKRRVSVARVAQRLFAFDDLCTCAEPACPLSGGLLTGATILCQCHGSRFDLASGEVLEGPATRALRVYALKEAGGFVRIDV